MNLQQFSEAFKTGAFVAAYGQFLRDTQAIFSDEFGAYLDRKGSGDSDEEIINAFWSLMEPEVKRVQGLRSLEYRLVDGYANEFALHLRTFTRAWKAVEERLRFDMVGDQDSDGD